MINLKLYLSFIGKVYKTSKLYVIAKLFLSILQGVFPVFSVILPQIMIDSLTINGNLQSFLLYAVLFVAVQFLTTNIYSSISIGLNYILSKMEANVTVETLDRIYAMSYDLYETPENHDKINRAFRFSTGAGINSIDSLIRLIATLITASSFFYIIARFNIYIIALVVIGVILKMAISKRKTKINFKFNNDMTTGQRRKGYFQNVLLDKYIAKEIRVSGGYNIIKERYRKENAKYSLATLKKDFKLFFVDQIDLICQNTTTLFIMISFGVMLFNKQLTIGQYTSTLNASMQFSGVILSLINAIMAIYSNVLETDNYRMFLNMTENKNQEINYSILEKEKKITIKFDDVSFKYAENSDFIVKDFSFVFISGNSYSILGQNGSGKSTLLKLALGLYKPQKGHIYINGIDISLINLENLYKEVSVIFQDFKFIHGISVKENLTLDNNEQDLVYIDEIIKSFDLYSKLNSQNFDLEKEYSKSFSEKGLEFSGGENQKLSIIRALLKNGKIFLMDEASSALDYLVEKKLYEKMRDIKNDKLVIYITHNLDMASYSDFVLIMKDGVLLCSGKYDEIRNNENLAFSDFIVI